MNTFGIIKGAVGIMVSAGVGTVVKNVINHTTPAHLSRMDKIAVKVGTLAIASVVSVVVENNISERLDGVHEQFLQTKAQIQAAGGVEKVVTDVKDEAEEKVTEIVESLGNVDLNFQALNNMGKGFDEAARLNSDVAFRKPVAGEEA